MTNMNPKDNEKDNETFKTFTGKHFVLEPTHAAQSAVECFKCNNCGEMFETDSLESKRCPVCGRMDTRGQDEIVMCSIEGF